MIGSNLANLGLVLGVAALIRPVTIQGQIIRRELPLLMLVTSIVAVMTLDRVLQSSEPALSRSDGLILLLLFSIFAYISISDVLGSDKDALLEDARTIEERMVERTGSPAARDWARVVGGLAGLSLGGHLTIVHGSALAVSLGVTPVIVGLLVVAIGTSMPELVTSIIAAMRQEADLCLGNVIGSNIFNSLMVLPVSAILNPLPIPRMITQDILVSLLLASALIPIFLFREARMGRATGAIFVATYVLYMTYRTVA